MKYDIRAGDYVETKDGDVGWVDNLVYNDTPRAYIDMAVRATKKHTYGEFHGYEDDLGDYFNRIGKYDFTKEENKQIKPMPDATSTIDYGSNGWVVDKIIEARNKINELVDKVNYLLDKQDKA